MVLKIFIIIIIIIIKLLHVLVYWFYDSYSDCFSNNFRPFELNFCLKMRHLLHQLRMELHERKILWKNFLQVDCLDMTINKV